jgi:hypothetical protein
MKTGSSIATIRLSMIERAITSVVPGDMPSTARSCASRSPTSPPMRGTRSSRAASWSQSARNTISIAWRPAWNAGSVALASVVSPAGTSFADGSQPCSFDTGSTPYGCFPIRTGGSGPRARTKSRKCRSRWARVVGGIRPGVSMCVSMYSPVAGQSASCISRARAQSVLRSPSMKSNVLTSTPSAVASRSPSLRPSRAVAGGIRSTSKL